MADNLVKLYKLVLRLKTLFQNRVYKELYIKSQWRGSKSSPKFHGAFDRYIKEHKIHKYTAELNNYAKFLEKALCRE